jgi:hypothetical protein
MKLFKNKIVEIMFWDHCVEEQGEKSNDLMKFCIWGRVEKVTKTVIIVRQWELQVGDAETRKHNNEIAKILVSSIIHIKELVIV